MATCKQCREFEKCKDDAFINGAKFDPNESVKYCTGFEPITNSDRIRAMSDEELADFFFESPEIEFTVCEYCEYFGGHTSDTPCKHEMGRCLVPAKNEAFKKWLKQPAEE